MQTLTNQGRPRRWHVSSAVERCCLAVALAISLSGCPGLQLAYYDPTTFHSLTALKPRVLFLYESFTQDPLPEEKIAEITLKLAQIYEYEKGKGDPNRETAQQVQKILEMFGRHVENRKQGKWSKTFMVDAKQNVSDAFDLAIRTERLKNKNE